MDERFRILSSIAADRRRRTQVPGGYEWWYFDAVSDDGRDLLVVIFLDNFVFSPRYNRDPGSAPTPALAVTWYRDGRVMLRSIREHAPTEFHASAVAPECRIADSGFGFEPAGEKTGGVYRVRLDLPWRKGARLSADLEWRVVDGDLIAAPSHDDAAEAHEWNMVAPRCRVTGELTITGRAGDPGTQHFRGTGYHDHNRDDRFLTDAISEWQWGRAHFDDVTAVFYRFREHGRAPVSRLLLVQNGDLRITNAAVQIDRARRHHFGLSYPPRLLFDATKHEDGAGARLMLDQARIVDGSFFYLRFAGQASLDIGDGIKREAPLVSEHLAPRALTFRWLDWLVNMRISRDARTAFLH